MCCVSELPTLPNEWVEQVLPKRQKVVQAPAIVQSPIIAPQSDTAARCRAYVATMPSAIQGQSGHSDLLRVANVIFHGFSLSEAEGWQMMLEYNSRCCPPWDLSNPRDERDFRRKIQQAIEKPLDGQPFGYLQNQTISIAKQADITTLVSNLNAQPNNEIHPETLRDKERIPERLQHVPGFIDKLVQFCVDHSPYPNRILALCGAIALMSFLTVRKVMFKSGARPNLYIIAVATSGTGKDYIRKVNKHILSMTGQLDNVGESIASGEGMEDEILCYKKKLFQTDEIQTLIRGITAGKDNHHLDYAAAFLMTAYSSADSEYIGRAKAGNRKKESRTVKHSRKIQNNVPFDLNYRTFRKCAIIQKQGQKEPKRVITLSNTVKARTK
ncbi:hypothetical protein FACS189427_12320 [Planctomycetales bacterium]|nr:hypothetical protein FACS189427_12320 [Planctomycetales bacterium]